MAPLPHEAGRMCGIGGHEYLLPGITHRGGRRHQPNARVAVLAVAPGEERLAEDAGALDTAEACREVRAVLQRFELGLGEGVIVAGIGPVGRSRRIGVRRCLGGTRPGASPSPAGLLRVFDWRTAYQHS